MKLKQLTAYIYIMLVCASCESTSFTNGRDPAYPSQPSGQSDPDAARISLGNQASPAAEAAFASTDYPQEFKRYFIEGYNDVRAGRPNRIYPNGKPTGQGADSGFLAEDEGAYIDGYEYGQ